MSAKNVTHVLILTVVFKAHKWVNMKVIILMLKFCTFYYYNISFAVSALCK